MPESAYQQQQQQQQQQSSCTESILNAKLAAMHKYGNVWPGDVV